MMPYFIEHFTFNRGQSKTVVASTNQVMIEFKSDSRMEGRGFNATYQQKGKARLFLG